MRSPGTRQNLFYVVANELQCHSLKCWCSIFVCLFVCFFLVTPNPTFVFLQVARVTSGDLIAAIAVSVKMGQSAIPSQGHVFAPMATKGGAVRSSVSRVTTVRLANCHASVSMEPAATTKLESASAHRATRALCE